MPGYTHLQVAQPTTFAHYLVAYGWAFARDLDRLTQAYDQTDCCTMGACALAGTSFPIDPGRIARLLGFERVIDNAMDAVGSRDFAVQTISALAILMTNLSRLAEELVLWSSAEFDMIAIPDKFAATSSIMPQKKNPVVAEIARAKVARLTGDLSGALATLRALPQSYSLDLQELTPLVWDAIDQAKSSVGVMSKLIGAIQPKTNVMRARAEDSFAAATELADTLVREMGLSFRAAHTVVGKMIARAVKEGKTPSALTLDDLQAACRAALRREIPLSEQKFKAAWDLEKCVAARKSLGGPAPASVKRQISQLQKLVKKRENLVRTRVRVIKKAEAKLLREAKRRSL
jgi:argininosuccinate lyase